MKTISISGVIQHHETVVKKFYELERAVSGPIARSAVDSMAQPVEQAFKGLTSNLPFSAVKPVTKSGQPRLPFSQSVAHRTVQFDDKQGYVVVIGSELRNHRPVAPHFRFNELGTALRYKLTGEPTGAHPAKHYLERSLEMSIQPCLARLNDRFVGKLLDYVNSR